MSRSTAWNHFERKSVDLAECSLCKNVIKTKGGSTSGLIRHLREKHGINAVSSSQSTSTGATASTSARASSSKRPVCHSASSAPLGLSDPKQRTLNFVVKSKNSLEETVARLAAQDGFSINGITNSVFIRRALAKEGHKLPINNTIVMSLVKTFYDETCELIRCELKRRIEKGQRFSLSTDEWTSVANRRYFNVNIHGTDEFVCNLGLVRILGSFTSERTLECVKEHVAEFGIDLEKHCVAVTADGVSVMVKFGRLSPMEYQGCWAHALHLAVCDFLYSGKSTTQTSGTDTTEDVELPNSSDSETDDDVADDEFIEDIEADEAVSGGDINFCTTTEPTLECDIYSAIKHVREDVKRFRRSPKDNEVLQKHVKSEIGKELKLILDVKTRWNTLCAMLERYCKIRPCLEKTFIDLKGNSKVTENELMCIKQLTSALEPVKLASDALCRNEASLLSADAVITFLLQTLEQRQSSQNNPLCKTMRDSILERISTRRNKTTMDLIQYLHSKTDVSKPNVFGNRSSKSVIQKYAMGIYTRLYGQSEAESADSIGQESTPVDDAIIVEPSNRTSVQSADKEKETSQTTLAEKFQLAIDCAVKDDSDTKDIKDLKTMTNDFKLYEAQKKRTPNLEQLYRALMTIKPSSVESERAFSAAGNFATRIRSRLGDKSLCVLVFLKNYFNNHGTVGVEPHHSV